MEKAEENYKVPNLEKGIAVLEYLSLYTMGKTLQETSRNLIFRKLPAYRDSEYFGPVMDTLYIMKIPSITNYPVNY